MAAIGELIGGRFSQQKEIDQMVSSANSFETPSSGHELRFHERGQEVRELLAGFPVHVERSIRRYVRHIDRRPTRRHAFVSDMAGLFELPAVRAYLLWDCRGSDMNRWAACAAIFIRAVDGNGSDLLGRYIIDLIPLVTRIVRPVLRSLRVSPRSELWQATYPRYARTLGLSLFGPLALLFFRTVACGKIVWNIVADRKHPEARPFAWVPGVEGLYTVLRFLLLGQIGKVFHRNALLYSPLAVYLIDQGLARRARCLRLNCPGCDLGGSPGGCGGCHRVALKDAGRWLLSGEYVSNCKRSCLPGKEPMVILDQPLYVSAYWKIDETAADRRTGRYVLSPPEELVMAEGIERALSAVGDLLNCYASAASPRLKRLAVWATVAGVDPAGLLCDPTDLDDETLLALLVGATRQRVTERQAATDQANYLLRWLCGRTGRDFPGRMTSDNFAVDLVRLRQDLRHEVRAKLTCKWL